MRRPSRMSVTAFGTTTKKTLRGSIATIRGEELAKRQASTVSENARGAVPGVQLTTATNQPGRTLPIYVPRRRFVLCGHRRVSLTARPSGQPVRHQPADIESISESKDATANSSSRSARRERRGFHHDQERQPGQSSMISVDTRFGINSALSLEYDIITDPANTEAQWRTMRHEVGAARRGRAAIHAAAPYASQEVLGARTEITTPRQHLCLPDQSLHRQLSTRPARRMYSERLQDELSRLGFTPQRNERFGQRRNEKSDGFISPRYL